MESPGDVMANARWEIPSLDPIVAIDSVSGSRSTLNRLLYQSVIARRNL